MTDEMNEEAEVEAAKKAIEDIVNKEIEEKKRKESEEKITNTKLADLGFATRKELEELEARHRERDEATRSILLKAKAQGKATIREKDSESDDEVRKLYKGILPGF